jgi:hypothetical protein
MAKGNTILLLGIAGVGYYGWTQGWFNSLMSSFGGSSSPAPLPTPTPTGQTSVNPAAVAQTPLPALGTKVTSSADALRQIAANDAYILSDPATFSQLQMTLPGGYGWVITTDNGGVLLRPDVYSAVQNVINNRVSRATSQGASVSSVQQAGLTNLGEIQQMMTNSGLNGLGDYQRHIYQRTGMARPFRVA